MDRHPRRRGMGGTAGNAGIRQIGSPHLEIHLVEFEPDGIASDLG